MLQSGYPVNGAKVRYEIGPEKMEATAAGYLTLNENGHATVDGGTLHEPGFIRLMIEVEWDGNTYKGYGTAGFSPDEIKPLATMLEDFSRYWAMAIEMARTVPLNPTMTLLPKQSSLVVEVYHISFQNEKPGSRIFGMLSVPAEPGKYPVVLQVPGAGVRPYGPNTEIAKRGAIHLAIGIHGIPVNMEPEVYQNLARGALAKYSIYGLGNRDTYYFRRVILGAVRAGDFLFNLPQADGQNYGVYGNSQGGALAIITAALDNRITRLGAIHPAMSDHEGYLQGRAGGWPHLFSPRNRKIYNTPENRETARYYDIVNFSRLVTAPGFYTWGFNDRTCPPTSMYAAYNIITAPKELWVIPETGHWIYPEQWEKAQSSIIDGFTRD